MGATKARLTTCNFDEIEEAGTYVEGRWGTLFRMPANALKRVPRDTTPRQTRERWPVIRVSRNPNISLAAAKRLAAHLGLRVLI